MSFERESSTYRQTSWDENRCDYKLWNKKKWIFLWGHCPHRRLKTDSVCMHSSCRWPNTFWWVKKKNVSGSVHFVCLTFFVEQQLFKRASQTLHDFYLLCVHKCLRLSKYTYAVFLITLYAWRIFFHSFSEGCSVPNSGAAPPTQGEGVDSGNGGCSHAMNPPEIPPRVGVVVNHYPPKVTAAKPSLVATPKGMTSCQNDFQEKRNFRY